jgi:hypothetical protein
MTTFYSFYTKSFGKLSETAFQLFWSGNYQQCCNLYGQIVANTGSIEALGLNDTLIYHHCSTQLGLNVLNNIQFPPPPTQEEILAIFDYEKSQECLMSSYSRRNLLSQPSVLSKAILAAHVGIQNGCQEAIETGTFLGASSYLFSGVFSKVDTVEADPRLFQSSNLWLSAKANNVQCHLGDSGDILLQVLPQKSKKQLIFLDAHYSTGITSREYGICPLIKELESLLTAPVDNVIVIDDIRCMETNGYPKLKEILDRIPEGKSVAIQYDQMIIS